MKAAYREGFCDGFQQGLRLAFEGAVRPPLFRPRRDDESDNASHETGRAKEFLENYRNAYAKAYAQSFQEGRARLLGKQLGGRFGELPGWVSERLLRGSDEQFDRWLERVLSAPTLDDVFAGD